MNNDLKVVKKESYGILNRIYYSIIKPSKYEKLSQLGLKKACAYLVFLIAIISIVLALLATYNVKNIISKGEQYITNNIPEIKFKNYELESDEEIILTNNEITDIFSYSIIINTKISSDEATQKYIDMKFNNNTVILLKNEFLIMNNDTKEFTEYKYVDSLKDFNIDCEKEYNKQDVITYLNSASLISYVIQYFALYFMTYIIIYIIIVVIIAILGFFIKSILKKEMNKHDLIKYSIYSITLSIIIFCAYLVINFFTNWTINYFEILIIIVSSIYMFLAIKSKTENIQIIDEKNEEDKENDSSEDIDNQNNNKQENESNNI